MSKFMLFDWRCTACHTKFEMMEKPSVLKVPCVECGEESKRLISAPRLDPRMGVDPDFPTAADKWAKTREQRKKIETRHFKEHGTDLAPGSSVKESSVPPTSSPDLSSR